MVFELPPLPRTVESAGRDLQSDDPRLRVKVVKDLARTRTPGERSEQVRLLVHCLHDKNGEVRREALLALADLEATEASSDVLPLLSDVELRVRQIAVLCLGEIALSDDETVRERLTRLLTAPEARIRYQAINALGILNRDGIESVLCSGLEDDDPEIRELCLRLVDEILLEEERELSEELRKQIHVRCRDEDAGIRLAAQMVAGQLGWDAPRDMLLAVIRRKWRAREPRDEQESILLAGRLGLTEALPSLFRRAFGWFGLSFDPFRWAALGALTRLGDAQAFDKLVRALNSKRAGEQTMAVQSLGESGDMRALPLLEALRGDESAIDQEVLSLAIRRLGACSDESSFG